MALSAIPSVKGALVAAITAALPGVQVTWSIPRADKERDWVMVGDVHGDQLPARIGRQSRKEDFRVEILVSIVKPDLDNAQEVAERAYQLAGEIEDTLRIDATLGALPPLILAEVVKTDLREGSAGGERWAEVTVHVRCQTRI